MTYSSVHKGQKPVGLFDFSHPNFVMIEDIYKRFDIYSLNLPAVKVTNRGR